MSEITTSPELAESYESQGYTNRKLCEKEIVKFLGDHGIFYSDKTGKIIAIEHFGGHQSTETDTTGWMLFDMLNFLNY